MSENYFNYSTKLKKEAEKALEVAKEVNKDKKVKIVPSGFSYDLERLRFKKKIKDEQYKSNHSAFGSN